jgi:hypothetical protein
MLLKLHNHSAATTYHLLPAMLQAVLNPQCRLRHSPARQTHVNPCHKLNHVMCMLCAVRISKHGIHSIVLWTAPIYGTLVHALHSQLQSSAPFHNCTCTHLAHTSTRESHPDVCSEPWPKAQARNRLLKLRSHIHMRLPLGPEGHLLLLTPCVQTPTNYVLTAQCRPLYLALRGASPKPQSA